jgi:hypothetical protein
MKILKTLTRPVVTHGAETWALRTTDELALRITDRSEIKIIYGALILSGDWRQRSNHGIVFILGHVDVVRFVRSRNISWLRHVQRKMINKEI